MNKKLKLMWGLPGSGKTTLAKKYITEGKGRVVRVNKDELRAMIFPGLAWHHSHEKVVIAAQKALVVSLMSEKDVDVIVVDDTNLNPSLQAMWDAFAKYCGLDMTIEKVETDVDTCIANDLKRKAEGGHYVGPDVIRNMASKYGLYKQTMPYVIFDLDGTLADITIRRQAAELPNGKLNYSKFFDPAMVDTDVPRHDIIEQTKQWKAKDHDIVICSGRSDRTRAATEAWLTKYGVVWDRLIMRPDANYQDDAILKINFLRTYLDPKLCVCVFDDRPKVIRAWWDAGLTVIDVGAGIEF